MKVLPCRGCGKPMFYGVRYEEDGRKVVVPLDAKIPCYRITNEGEDGTTIVRDRDVYVTHFATCPKANQFSRRRPAITKAEAGEVSR